MASGNPISPKSWNLHKKKSQRTVFVVIMDECFLQAWSQIFSRSGSRRDAELNLAIFPRTPHFRRNRTRLDQLPDSRFERTNFRTKLRTNLSKNLGLPGLKGRWLSLHCWRNYTLLRRRRKKVKTACLKSEFATAYPTYA